MDVPFRRASRQRRGVRRARKSAPPRRTAPARICRARPLGRRARRLHGCRRRRAISRRPNSSPPRAGAPSPARVKARVGEGALCGHWHVRRRLWHAGQDFAGALPPTCSSAASAAKSGKRLALRCCGSSEACTALASLGRCVDAARRTCSRKGDQTHDTHEPTSGAVLLGPRGHAQTRGRRGPRASSHHGRIVAAELGEEVS